jgi:hypothetical protein
VALVDLRWQAEADGGVSVLTDSTSRSIALSSTPWLRRSVGTALRETISRRSDTSAALIEVPPRSIPTATEGEELDMAVANITAPCPSN